MILISLLLFAAEICFGSINIPISDTLSILLGNPSVHPGWDIIIFESRIPRALTAVAGGIALSVGGLLMQTLFRNPLAGPSVLGITSGSSLAVALVIMATSNSFFLHSVAGTAGIAFSAMGGALLVLLLLLIVSERLKDNVSLLIFGIMLGHFAGAIESILQHRASKESLRDFVLWGMGTFAESRQAEIIILVTITFIATGFVFFLLPALNLLLLGEDYAISMGLRVKRLRKQIILITGLLSGVTTAFCGPVAFIGLAVPHLSRALLRQSDHRRLFPVVLLLGSITALGSDLLSRLLEVPLNAITSALGAPVVIYIIIRGARAKAII
ncbi:MAG: iron ABC transporter permease [Crocinitomicaceae bacterium]|nr:iron ABC transporter permease [Crocinitomicaceae bacterium]